MVWRFAGASRCMEPSMFRQAESMSNGTKNIVVYSHLELVKRIRMSRPCIRLGA